MNEISSTKMMTTKELAERLETSPKVILENARKCLPNKIVENGKPTFWNEAEITVLVDYAKENSHRHDTTFTNLVKVTETELTPALRIRKAMLEMQAAYEDELAILRQKNIEQQNLLDEQKPKVDYVDSYCDSTNLEEIGHLGKVTKIGEQKIFRKLLDDGYIKIRYSTDGVKCYDPCYGYEKYFETVHVPFLRGDRKLNRDKLMLNHSGFLYFRKKYCLKEAE